MTRKKKDIQKEKVGGQISNLSPEAEPVESSVELLGTDFKSVPDNSSTPAEADTISHKQMGFPIVGIGA